MKMFKWATLFAILVLFMVFASAPQSSPIEEISIDIVISESPDVLQTSIENTGSDIWSDANFNTRNTLMPTCSMPACFSEATILKWPRIARLNYKLFTANGYDAYTSYWCRPVEANKNNFIT